MLLSLGDLVLMTRKAVNLDEVVLVANDHGGHIANLRELNLNDV